MRAGRRYRPAERAAVVNHRVQPFRLNDSDLRAAVMAERLLLAVADGIARACAHPALVYTVSATGLRRVDLG